jgi:hypothetical protein
LKIISKILGVVVAHNPGGQSVAEQSPFPVWRHKNRAQISDRNEPNHERHVLGLGIQLRIIQNERGKCKGDHRGVVNLQWIVLTAHQHKQVVEDSEW